ncbi:hypothetical protein Y032_0124g1191 [Ancylostoma ceylanicum]|uniref:Uncharacterized protein n=1 Tax=Ancylostoma ceylanicum TaxID=53326 RepID=A0A016T886_9BILA|nr:hypothetical protein Y032_0124g1191 [Ancylostoma ceylanicum]
MGKITIYGVNPFTLRTLTDACGTLTPIAPIEVAHGHYSASSAPKFLSKNFRPNFTLWGFLRCTTRISYPFSTVTPFLCGYCRCTVDTVSHRILSDFA